MKFIVNTETKECDLCWDKKPTLKDLETLTRFYDDTVDKILTINEDHYQIKRNIIQAETPIPLNA